MPAAPTLLPSPGTAPGRPTILRVHDVADPAAWAGEHRAELREILATHGALLVRGLGLVDLAVTGAVFRTLASELMVEREAFAAREAYPGGVYSATTWPANQQMCMHHELSYACEVPALMMFACVTAPALGGATCVADAAEVLRALPAELVERAERVGWLLTRNYNDEIGASFQDAFGTSDRAEVETYCRANSIEFTWLPDDGLRTRQRRPAVLRHPVTGARCWFNQLAFLSEWTLAEEVREYLVDEYGPDGLPFNTSFGDGEPIDAEIVATINDAYEIHTRREPWQSGDLLLVDNLACAHSRDAFTGAREVLVAPADPVRVTETATTGVDAR